MGNAQATPARKASVDALTGEIDEARTASLSLYVIVDRSDYAPLRTNGQRVSISGGKIVSANERKQAQEIADKINAHYQASKIDRCVEVIETLAWRARRVEQLVELIASAELTR
jgi:hypothetical protein